MSDQELATYDDSFAAFQAAADALQGEGKPILKFKKGDWLFGADGEEFKYGSVIAGNINEAEWGWTHWHDGKPDERRMVRIATGRHPVPRNTLGDQDEDLWETDEQGNKVDPWQKTFDIPSRELYGDRREFVLTGSSRGYEGAFKKLLAQFGKEMKLNHGKIPLIELDGDKYKHSNPQYDWVKVPVMRIVAWKTADELEAYEPEEAKPAKRARF